MKALITLLLVLAPILTASGAEPVEDWMTFYYKNPTPDQFTNQVRAMAEKGRLKDQNTQPPLVAFFSQIMARNPNRISAWLKEFETLDAEQRNTLLAAAWYSDTDSAREYFNQYELKDYLKKAAPKILEIEIDNPGTLDMLWGYFMATGDAAPIRRLVSAFSLSKHAGALARFKDSAKTEQDKKDAYLDATFQAAQWSLESNCRHHPQVLAYLEKILEEDKLSPDESLWLGVLLSKVKPDKYHIQLGDSQSKNDRTSQNSSSWRKDGEAASDTASMKSKNGFGAQLFLIDDTRFFDDWSKPETPKLTPLAKAQRSVPVFTAILFVDPGTDPNGAANVTCDIVVRKPDGTVYGEQKDMGVWTGKYSTPAHNLQLAAEHMGIRIEEQDPGGIYTVEAIVRDHIKKIDLPLKATFEVSK